MINSAKIWDFSQHGVITIALDKVNQSDLSVPGKKCDFFGGWGEYVPGARRLSEPLIYHRCAFFETTGKTFASTFGRNFLLSCGHYRASTSGKRSHWVHKHACMGVSARISTHTLLAHSLVHRCTETTCAKHPLTQDSDEKKHRGSSLQNFVKQSKNQTFRNVLKRNVSPSKCTNLLIFVYSCVFNLPHVQ